MILKYPSTVIWRHRKENLRKCSLRGLESRPDMQFFTYPNQELPALEGYILLAMEAPPLSPMDGDRGLLLVDATWRYAALMLRRLESTNLIPRSIPAGFRTAYPRRQSDCPNPDDGLASIEALHIAYHLMGRDTRGLLDHYYWRESFLQQNALS